MTHLNIITTSLVPPARSDSRPLHRRGRFPAPSKHGREYQGPAVRLSLGMDDAEADPILDALFAFVTDRQRRWHYRHEWRDDDLVFWDNRCVCHRAVGGYGLPDIRCLHRTVVAGDRASADQDAA